MTGIRENSRDDQGFDCARARKRAPSTTTRSTVPAPTTTSASKSSASEPAASAPAGRAMNPNTSRLPSTSVSSASTTTSAPSGLALRCSRLTAVPTVVSPSVRFGATAATVAASASASSRGVASTGRFPLPIASAVSAPVTTARTVARSPAARPGMPPGTPALFNDGNQVAFLNHVTLGHGELGEGALALGKDRDLHFHGLQDDQRVPVSYLIALGRHDLPHVRDHLRADLGHTCLLAQLPGDRSRRQRHHHSRSAAGHVLSRATTDVS